MYFKRTTAEQEVLALFALLGKLIVMHKLEKIQLLLENQPSLPSGVIRANICNTSCSAVVLLHFSLKQLKAKNVKIAKIDSKENPITSNYVFTGSFTNSCC